MSLDALRSDISIIENIIAQGRYATGGSYYYPAAVVQECVLAKPVRAGTQDYRPVIRVAGIFTDDDTGGSIGLITRGYYKFPGFPARFGLNEMAIISDISQGPPGVLISSELNRRIEAELDSHLSHALHALAGMSPYQAFEMMMAAPDAGTRQAALHLQSRFRQWFDVDPAANAQDAASAPLLALPPPARSLQL